MRITRFATTTCLLGSFLLGSSAGAADAVMYSGFINGYPDFKQDPDGGGGLIYRKAGVDLGDYNKIMIEPIEIWVADASEYKGFSPDDLKKTTDELYRKLVANLEPDYPVVSQPGEGVLVLRLAITDVYAKKKKRGLLGFISIDAVTGSYNANLMDATIEAELLDARSRDQLGVLVDKLSVSKGGDDKTSWEEISKALNFYAKRFRSRMDAAHSK